MCLCQRLDDNLLDKFIEGSQKLGIFRFQSLFLDQISILIILKMNVLYFCSLLTKFSCELSKILSQFLFICNYYYSLDEKLAVDVVPCWILVAVAVDSCLEAEEVENVCSWPSDENVMLFSFCWKTTRYIAFFAKE